MFLKISYERDNIRQFFSCISLTPFKAQCKFYRVTNKPMKGYFLNIVELAKMSAEIIDK